MANPKQPDLISLLEQVENGKINEISNINWPRGLNSSSPEYQTARQAIARLRQNGNTGTALKLVRSLAAAVPEDRSVMLQHGRILWFDGKFAQAAKLLDASGPVGADHEWYSLRAAISNSMGEFDNALEYTGKYREAAPLVVTQRFRRELPIVAILHTGPYTLTEPEPAFLSHFTGNFVSQYASLGSDKFRFASYWVNTSAVSKALKSSPVPNIVVNNVASGEAITDPELFQQLGRCINYWNRYCINNPKSVRATARDKLASVLSKSSRIISPKTQYFKTINDANAMADQVEKEFDYPFILRAPFFQDGADMYLVENRDQALEFIPTLEPGFFAVEFINNLHQGNMYRKMRGAFIEDEFFMLRVDYGPDWMVHGHRNKPHRIEFYNENPQYLEEELAICKDPTREFGRPVMRAFRELRSILKLDYFGVDFDITENGELIVYEANAAMNFLDKSKQVHPHPIESGEAITESFTKFLMNSINRPKMAMMR